MNELAVVKDMELPADIKPVMVTRSNYLIEARFNLTVKQNEIIDIILNQVNDDDNLDYEVVIGNFEEYINESKSNIYRDFQRAAKEFQIQERLSVLAASGSSALLT